MSQAVPGGHERLHRRYDEIQKNQNRYTIGIGLYIHPLPRLSQLRPIVVLIERSGSLEDPLFGTRLTMTFLFPRKARQMSAAAEEGELQAEGTRIPSAAASVSDEPSTPPPVVASNDLEGTTSAPDPISSALPTINTVLDDRKEPLPLKTEDAIDSTPAKNDLAIDDTEMKEEPQDSSDNALDPRSPSVQADVRMTPRLETKEESVPQTDVSAVTESTEAINDINASVATSLSAPLATSEPIDNASIDQKVTAASSEAQKTGGDDLGLAVEKEAGSGVASTLGSTSGDNRPTETAPAFHDTDHVNARGDATLASTSAPTELVETSAESSQAAGKRNPALPTSAETQQRARQEESSRIQRESEDMRLQWLSLPANDHITYYSDTEDDASSEPTDAMTIGPIGAFGGMPHLTGLNSRYTNNRKRNRHVFDDEKESSDSDDEKMDQEVMREEHQYRTGNRGNKLLKSSRWIRRGKLGVWTEAKTEKDYHDRFMSRVKAIQRAGVESLLHNAPGPKVIKEDGSLSRDMLEGSDRLLLRDVNKPIDIRENLHSTSLAPALLRPILSARALLESHTLRHTFRNPHIGALSKTALDLRESESQLAKALGRCFAAMERTSAYIDEPETGQVRVNGSQITDGDIDVHIIGAENTAGTADEVNPTLYRLEDLFITKKGLPIPVSAGSDNESQATAPGDSQAVLSTTDQRNVVRAALECLTDLAADSLEYVERLEEVRGRLESAKKQRTHVWEALRLWAIKREFGEEEEEEEVIEEVNGLDNNINRSTSKPGAATAAATASAATANRRRR